MKLAYAFCGSFCTHKRALEALRGLAPGNDVTPVLSETVQSTDTRFGRAYELAEAARLITGARPMTAIKEAEEIITRGGFDAVIISPCTGNTLAKLAAGITDGVVTMCAKAQLRSLRPVLIALATNDGLGANLKNVAALLERKNVFFVPFGQDDAAAKPNSLVCDFGLLPGALEAALKGRQIQPLLL
ncbi:MAG: dipicolinate synthase subunit B [Clostridia bacterium]|nr:dipicolinate synthase subunit B [Clostridia bacterium]